MHGRTRIRLHGRRVWLNLGFAYPAFIRRWPRYNDPLVRLVNAVARARGTTLAIVDVGAAVGDTVLLLVDRAKGAANSYICVEPEDEFHSYLIENLSFLPTVEIHQTMLSDTVDLVPAPVRIHPGTASPQGQIKVSATTLDAILGGRTVDVIKIDTDGYDGKVLAGTRRTLAMAQPAVIFEWHPALLTTCGQSLTLPFEVLGECGYRLFVWFTKHGEFSHVEHTHDPRRTARLAQMCLSGSGPEPDWHYDVVALPPRLEGLDLW
jgi:FkbM family methyltransferase